MTNPSGTPPARRAAGEEVRRSSQRPSLDKPGEQPVQAQAQQAASPVATARAAAAGSGGNRLTAVVDLLRGRFSGLNMGTKIWIGVGALAAVVIFGVLMSFIGNASGSEATAIVMPTPRPAAPSNGGEPVLGFTVEGPEQVRVNASLTLATVFVVLLILFGLAETIGRRERFALDFWAPIFYVLVAVFRAQMIRDLWLILQTAASCLVVVAIALNENRPVGKAGGNAWSQIFNLITGTLDMTPLYVGAALLLALKYAAWVIMPYPLWIPIQIVWVALLAGSLFEMSRVPLPSLLAIVLGAAAGFLFNPWLTVIAALVVVIMGAIFAQIGWLPKTRHENVGAVEAMGHNLNMTLRWDLVIMAVIAFFLVAIGAHGNIVLWTIMAR